MALDRYDPPTVPWLDTVYQGDGFCVYNKPSGLLSVPGRDPKMHDSLLSRARAHHPSSEAVHRLDMCTSGLMIIAYDKQVERLLKRQFSDRIPKKSYEALVWGQIKDNTGTISEPLICDWPNRPRQKICYESGKPSITEYQVIGYEQNLTRVKLTPITGRSHQLRVHMESLGHSIVGDEFYATSEIRSASPRLCLHAKELIINDPHSNEPLVFSTKVPF